MRSPGRPHPAPSGALNRCMEDRSIRPETSTVATPTYLFRIDSDGDDDTRTRVLAAQSMGGIATRTMRPMLQKVAERSVVGWLNALSVSLEGD